MMVLQVLKFFNGYGMKTNWIQTDSTQLNCSISVRFGYEFGRFRFGFGEIGSVFGFVEITENRTDQIDAHP